jgi:hypothetical protein
MFRSVEGCHHWSVVVLVGEDAELRAGFGKGPEGEAGLEDTPAREAAGLAGHDETAAEPPTISAGEIEGGTGEADLGRSLYASGAPLLGRHAQEDFRRDKFGGRGDQGA